MMRIRAVEEKIAKEYSQQKMRCPTHLSIGQAVLLPFHFVLIKMILL